MVKFVEDGIYNCGIYRCTNKAKHAQNIKQGTILLCDDCFGKVWKMTPLGIRRLKGEDV